MQKFFSFLKQNKILFFVLLGLFVWTGLLCVPSYAKGFAGSPPSSADTLMNSVPAVPSDLAEDLTLDWKEVLNPLNLMAAAGMAVVDGSYRISQYCAYALDYTLKNILRAPITTKDAGFLDAWAQIRNLGNMLIVLGFVVVGIATALRIQTYAATKLLWPLILVAILVNFSGLFCGLIIDASNLVTTGLMQTKLDTNVNQSQAPVQIGGATHKGTLDTISTTLVKEIKYTSVKILNHDLFDKGLAMFFVGCCLFGFVYLGMAFTFLYLTVLLIARYVVLIMLFILSPLAFTFWVFPASQHLWKEWWNHFVKWSFVGVFGAFVLFLTNIILSQQALLKSGATNMTDFAQMGPLFIQIIIVLGFMAIGFKMTAKSSGIASMATGAVLGLATGGAALAAGSVGKGASFLSNKTGLSRVGSRIGNSTGRLAERFGLRQEGTTAAAAAKQMKSKQDSIGNLDLDRQATLAGGSAMSHNAAQDKVAAIQNLAKTGNMHRLGTIDQQRNALSYAQSYMRSRGVDTSGFMSDAEKSDPRLRAANNVRIENEMRDNLPAIPANVTGAARTVAIEQRRSAAQHNIIAQGFADAKTPDIRGFHPNVLRSDEFIENTSANKIERAAAGMSTSQVNALRDHLAANSHLNNLITNNPGNQELAQTHTIP